jgi:hypothetical protein
MRDGRGNRTMMRARQCRVDLQHMYARRIGTRTCMRGRMTSYGYVVHNAPSSDKPDMTVYTVLDFKATFKTGQGEQWGTHQLLIVSRPCTSELRHPSPFPLECLTFHLLVSHERYEL